MRGLTIVVTTGARDRFRAALTLSCAHAALGGRTRVYCHEAAVALLADRDDPAAASRAAHGLPDAPALIATALDGGVEILACQTGLALSGLAHSALPGGIEASGRVALLAELGDDRLVTI